MESYQLGGVEKAIVTTALIMAMLVQVLDTTIANVALPHMQTSLGATRDTVNWVLTSYIVATAIAIPITGWLADRVGRRRLFISSVIAFTFASVLCALAQNLAEMVAFRAVQGVAGAFIVPLAQSTMLDINPREKHGRAMALFGAGVMIGPILGPVLGGWLTESFSWRWVFLVNLPIGAVAVLLMLRYLPSAPKQKRRFDLFGFALLALALGALQMMLDRGEQVDWFQSWEVWIEAGLALSAAWMFGVHMLTARNPIFDPQMFRDRNFTVGLLFMAVTGVMLLAGLALLPPLLQGLYGYSVLQSGILTMPRGVGTLASMLIASWLINRIDARLVVLLGIGLMALSLHQMSGFSLEMDTQPIIVSGIIQGLALGLIFVPLNTLAFATMDQRFRTTGASLFNLSRNIGGSIGISVVTAFLGRNLQVSHADLASHITSSSLPPIDPALTQGAPLVTDAALAMIDAEINRQALMIAFIDDFHLMMLVSLAAVPLLLLLRKFRPQKDVPAA
ncbi:MAG: DHA2 family efflux MFS transporter permease subunit [Allosphingosinicella sp.]